MGNNLCAEVRLHNTSKFNGFLSVRLVKFDQPLFPDLSTFQKQICSQETFGVYRDKLSLETIQKHGA